MEAQSSRESWSPGTGIASGSNFLDSLAQAVALAEQIDKLLASPPDRLHSQTLLRVRLARALVLGVVDQLEDLVRKAR